MRWLKALKHALWVRLIGPEGVEDRRREEETRRVIAEAQSVLDRLRKTVEHPIFKDSQEGETPQ